MICFSWILVHFAVDPFGKFNDIAGNFFSGFVEQCGSELNHAPPSYMIPFAWQFAAAAFAHNPREGLFVLGGATIDHHDGLVSSLIVEPRASTARRSSTRASAAVRMRWEIIHAFGCHFVSMFAHGAGEFLAIRVTLDGLCHDRFAECEHAFGTFIGNIAQGSRSELAGFAHIVGAEIDDGLAGFAGKFLNFAIDLSGYLCDFRFDLRRALLFELRFDSVIHGFLLK
jgi:hypothetical protein